MSALEITVRDGIGARVTAMANALSSGCRELRFGWAVNEHLPLRHEQVFPDGIPDVVFTEPEGDCSFAEWNGLPMFTWHAADNRGLADAAYGRIMAAMTGTGASHAVGVHARFHRMPHARPLALAVAAHRAARGRPVFLLADRYREELTSHIETMGTPVICAACPDLPADLDRTEADTLDFLSDWQTLLACPTIVTLDGPSCMLNPARAAGRQIIYAGALQPA